MELLQWAGFLLAPITGIVTWFAGRHMQRLDYVQKEVDVVNALRNEIAELCRENRELRSQVAALTSQVQIVQQCFDQYIADSDRRLAEAMKGGRQS